jgi:hypothetical protein
VDDAPVWKEHVGYYPPGLGEAPRLFSDSAWWAKQTGTGRVFRLGLGDANGDLQALGTTIAAADSTMASGQYGLAVTMYQSAGATGASTVGPEIDSQTNGSSKPLTQQAWAINGNLQAVNSDVNTATAADAQSAQGFARQMLNIYQQALAGGSAGPTAQPSQALLSAAGALVDWLAQNGCTQSYIQACYAFQTQYNAEGSVMLATDGKYGSDTQAALQRVMQANNVNAVAPANCFPGGGSEPANPPLVTPTVVVTGSPSTNWTPWLIGGAALGGAGLIGYAYWKKHHRRAGRH